MTPELAPLLACVLLSALLALPACAAVRRRSVNREHSAVAAALVEFAGVLRRSQQGLPFDEDLLARVRRLDAPELLALEFACALQRPEPELLADTAQRLALRLKRRVAFERKMLARTAAGRWRAALAGSACIIAILVMSIAGMVLPNILLVLVLLLGAIGCWFSWRVAQVDV
jgi:hypothetical protein